MLAFNNKLHAENSCPNLTSIKDYAQYSDVIISGIAEQIFHIDQSNTVVSLRTKHIWNVKNVPLTNLNNGYVSVFSEYSKKESYPFKAGHHYFIWARHIGASSFVVSASLCSTIKTFYTQTEEQSLMQDVNVTFGKPTISFVQKH